MKGDRLFQFLFNEYQKYSLSEFSKGIITHSEVKRKALEFSRDERIKLREIGKSVNGREIYLLSIGSGKINVLAWSQMHGDEPTATKAIFDILNFLSADDEYNEFKNFIRQNLKIHFIPMLNPDGAEKFQRENIVQIDINRDYKSLQSPESLILKSVAKEIKPDFAFNLHDQNNYYAAGNTNKSSVISFLAPPVDYNNTIPDSRKKAMQLIVKLNDTLSKYIPGHIGRYKDEYEPRSFGDNFTKTGSATVLIESGNWQGKKDKSFARKLNFILLLRAFEIIARKEYSGIDIKQYFEIPENKEIFFDLILRNTKIVHKEKEYVVDIAINRDEFYDAEKDTFYYKGIVKDIGDLSVYFGHEEHDLRNICVLPGKIYSNEIGDVNELTSGIINEMLKQGVLYVKTRNLPLDDYIGLPVNIIKNKNFEPVVKREQPANLIISDNNEIKYLVVNGFFYDFHTPLTDISNGLII